MIFYNMRKNDEEFAGNRVFLPLSIGCTFFVQATSLDVKFGQRPSKSEAPFEAQIISPVAKYIVIVFSHCFLGK